MNTLTVRDALEFAGLDGFYAKSGEDDDRSEHRRFHDNTNVVNADILLLELPSGR